jgi:hypothetical protein
VTIREFETRLDELICAALRGGLYMPSIIATLELKIRALRNEAPQEAPSEANEGDD